MTMFTEAVPLESTTLPGSTSNGSDVTTDTEGFDEGVTFQYLSTA